jgi:Domain of unknown function (DUF4349)
MRRSFRRPAGSLPRRVLALFLLLALGAGLAACSGGSGSGSSASDLAGGSGGQVDTGSAEAAATGSASDSGSASGSGSGSSGTTRSTAAGSGLNVAAALARRVRTAQISVEVTNLPAAAARVRAIAVALGGVVSSESSGFLPASDQPVAGGNTGTETGSQATPATGQSVITLRVPEPKLEDALTRLSAVGREVDRSTSTEDVTATIADLDSRVQTQVRSVARVRDLLARARSLSDIVLLESELARREADLESVQARQRALADQADLATVTVTLRTPAAATTAEKSDGFLAGLQQGWHAVKVSTTVVLTVIGAVLPVLLALALLGWPALLVYRRLRPRPARPSAPSPSGPAPSGPAPSGPAPAVGAP